MRPLIIGIAGGTGSGKTTLVENLKEQFGADISVLPHDNYYALRRPPRHEPGGASDPQLRPSRRL